MVSAAQLPDEHYEGALALVLLQQKSSTSWLQRQLGIGYNTASQLIERMERNGIVGAPDHVGRREILLAPDPENGPALVEMAQRAIARRAQATVDTQIEIPVDLPNENRKADDKLRLLIERVERLEEEKKGVGDDIKDVYLEAKAVGYDTKIMRQIVRLRKMQPDDRKEMEAILDLYKAALGLG